MVSWGNQQINIRRKPSVNLTRNNKLEGEIDFCVDYIQGSIVDIDYELERLRQIPYLKPEEQKKIAKLQDAFYRLFHQTAGISDIQQPLECC